MIYTGIGSRACPEDVFKQLAHIGQVLAFKGYTLRSGGAEGADSAFEFGHGCNNNIPRPKEIYLPWKGFNNNSSTLFLNSTTTPITFSIASQIYPNWEEASHAVKCLHARNVQQILGNMCDSPTSFVVAWTDRPEKQGPRGSNFALFLAKQKKIPTFNLYIEKQRHDFADLLKTLKRNNNELH